MTIDVKGGNRRALQLMIGQGTSRPSRPGAETVFLHWAHRIPTVVDASSLKAGDRIVIRDPRRPAARASQRSRRPPAKRVADREPKAQESNQNAQA